MLIMKKLLISTIILGAVALGIYEFFSTNQTLGAVDPQIMDAYVDKGTFAEVQMLQTIPDEGEVKIEMIKSRPEVRLKKWNGEINMGVRYDDINAVGSLDTDKKFKWKKGQKELHAYPLKSKEGMEGGGVEIELVLKSKPATNVFNFQIDGAEELDFFYQSALTQQEIDEGASRPENVIGSYAVYHKTKANHRVGSTNYATGKAYHIYRPKAIDALGVEVWAELLYENGVLSVTVSQSFLNGAIYPVSVDPTFGYTTIGISQISIFSEDSWVAKFTLTENGDVEKLSRYGQDSSGSFSAKGLTYSDSSTYPNALQGGATQTATFTTTAAWKDLTYSISVSLSTGTYWIGVAVSADRCLCNYDSSTNEGNAFDSDTDNYTSPPDPHDGGISINTTVIQSIYATYTASGGGGGNTSNPPARMFIQNGQVMIQDSQIKLEN